MNMQKKLVVLFIIILLAFLGLAGRLVYITETKGDEYTKNVLSQQKYQSTTLPYKRGDILDSKGTKLAISEKVYNLITTGKTSELIGEYEAKYKELVNKSLYMQEGIIDHNNYGNISSTLNINGFFMANNEVVLKAKDGSASLVVKKQKDLDRQKNEILLTSEGFLELETELNNLILNISSHLFP